MSNPKYLDRKQAADYCTNVRGVKVSWRSLQKMATIGGGPKYVVIAGRALMTEQWLDEWIERRTSAPRCTTSEAVAGVA